VRDQKKYLGHFLTQVTAVQSSYEFTFDWQKIRALYDKIFKAQEQLLTSSIHDVSDGGMLVALFETLVLHKGGLEFTIPKNQDEVAFLYSELPGHFLISVLPEKRSEFESLFEADEYYFLGPVTSSGRIQFNNLELDIDRLAEAWSGL
jgi:phosphoribosylformylglycinamidine synthase